jgi:DegV family protein with EDD domain
MKIAYVTDSGTGRSIEDLARDGIISIPLQISDGDTTYQDMETLSKNDCIDLLTQGHVLKTSQPSPGVIEELFESLKEQGTDLIIAVPICNGLSGTISTMTAVARSLDLKIICVDTYVTAVVQDYLIHAIRDYYMSGKSEIETRLMENQVIDSTNTLIMPESLDQLVRGGRLTPMAARLAKLLRISPVLQINKRTAGRIDTLAKVRTFHRALNTGLDQMEKDGIGDGEGWSCTIAHVHTITEAERYYHLMAERFPKLDIQIIDLCNAVAAHCGIGTIAIQYFRKLA